MTLWEQKWNQFIIVAWPLFHHPSRHLFLDRLSWSFCGEERHSWIEQNIYKRLHRFLPVPVSLKLAHELSPACRMAAGLKDAFQPGPVRFDRRAANSIDDRVHFITLSQHIERGEGRQASVHNAVMMSFLRPVALTAAANSTSSQAMIVVRSSGSIPVRTFCSSGIVGLFTPVLTLTVERTIGRPTPCPSWLREQCSRRARADPLRESNSLEPVGSQWWAGQRS